MKVWVKWLILGILSIIFGLFVLANPIAASVSVTIMAGILFAASGVFQIVAGFGEEGTWAKLVGIVIGLFMVLLGISLMFLSVARRAVADAAGHNPVRRIGHCAVDHGLQRAEHPVFLAHASVGRADSSFGCVHHRKLLRSGAGSAGHPAGDRIAV